MLGDREHDKCEAYKNGDDNNDNSYKMAINIGL